MRLKLVISAIALCIVVAMLFCLKTHKTDSIERLEVTLDVPYMKAVRAFEQKSVLEEIVAAGGGELLEQTWDKFDLSFAGRPRSYKWELNASGRFKVRYASDDFSGDMEVLQVVHASRDGTTVHSKLARPEKFIKAHETSTFMNGNRNTVLRVENRIVYERLIPFWMEDELDARVAEYNKKLVRVNLDILKSAIQKP